MRDDGRDRQEVCAREVFRRNHGKDYARCDLTCLLREEAIENLLQITFLLSSTNNSLTNLFVRSTLGRWRGKVQIFLDTFREPIELGGGICSHQRLVGRYRAVAISSIGSWR